MNRERGASLVEFALVLPLLLMIILGLVSAGAAYNLKITLTHAAREAARYAATLPISNFNSESDPTVAWLQAVEDRLVQDAEGQLDATDPGVLTCVAIIEETTASTTIHSLSSDGTPTDQTCFSDERVGNYETRVQVSAARQTELNALLFSTDITVSSDAVAFYERED